MRSGSEPLNKFHCFVSSSLSSVSEGVWRALSLCSRAFTVFLVCYLLTVILQHEGACADSVARWLHILLCCSACRAMQAAKLLTSVPLHHSDRGFIPAPASTRRPCSMPTSAPPTVPGPVSARGSLQASPSTPCALPPAARISAIALAQWPSCTIGVSTTETGTLELIRPHRSSCCGAAFVLGIGRRGTIPPPAARRC